MEQYNDFNEQAEMQSEEVTMKVPVMRSIGDFLKDGWNSLSGHWGNAVLLILVCFACVIGIEVVQFILNLIISMIYILVNGTQVTTSDQIIIKLLSYPFSLSIMFFATYPLTYGLCNSFVKAKRANSGVSIKDIFLAKEQYLSVVGTGFLYNLYLFLWLLLALIPFTFIGHFLFGNNFVVLCLFSLAAVILVVYKLLSYQLCTYIRYDHPELSANECINLSIEMMDGHKTKLLGLVLIFVVLAILSVFTCCIGFLFSLPYMYSIMAEFYEDVKADYEYKQHFIL